MLKKIDNGGNLEGHFGRFSYTKGRKRAKTTQLRRLISQQPFGVERQVSPF